MRQTSLNKPAGALLYFIRRCSKWYREPAREVFTREERLLKRMVFIAGLICMYAAFGSIASAEETKPAGAAQTGTTIYFGYNGNYLYYQEVVHGDVLDKDNGLLYGGYFEVRGDNEYLLVRISVDYSWTDSAKYTGALQNGTPISLSTREEFYLSELSIGYKALNFSTATLTPYAGVGYRRWIRGEDKLPSYQEDYSWWYVAVGLNLAYRYDKWVFALDGAVAFPFESEMTTSIAGLYDPAVFNIKSRPGYRVQASVNYTVYANNNLKVLVFGTPYYQRWNIKQSDTVILTQNGVPVQAAYEPKSSTDLYGLKLGVGVNF
jgi:hypothetical protein